MLNKLSPLGQIVLGCLIAGVLFFVPEAKPIACGVGFNIPVLTGEP